MSVEAKPADLSRHYPQPEETTLVLGDVLDRLVRGEEELVMVGTRVIQVSPVASVILDEVATEPHMTFERLTGLLAEVFGHPPTGSIEEATRESVAELVRLGALVEHRSTPV